MGPRVTVDPASLDGTFLSEAEYLALPETMRKVELVDGLVVCEPSATFEHQHRSGELHLALGTWAGTRSPRPTVVAAPLDVRFAPGRILQPDLVVYLEPLVRPVPMPVLRIPDLCVEIASRRAAWDRTAKRAMYAEAGVRELWIVLAQRPVVERWSGAGLDNRDEHDVTLQSPLLPGFAMDLGPLFE